jgi:F0F1-type ATP synthase epsilon subunit
MPERPSGARVACDARDAEKWLVLVVRTPREEVVRRRVRAVRVPTETGSVGILPRAERAALVVEPGLVVARGDATFTLVGTAGGLLRIDRDQVILLSPLAIVGDDAGSVRERVAELTRETSAEAELRRHIEMLERGLVAESRRRGRAARMGAESR